MNRHRALAALLLAVTILSLTASCVTTGGAGMRVQPAASPFPYNAPYF